MDEVDRAVEAGDGRGAQPERSVEMADRRVEAPDGRVDEPDGRVEFSD